MRTSVLYLLALFALPILCAAPVQQAHANEPQQLVTGVPVWGKQIVDNAVDNVHMVVGADFDGDHDIDLAATDYLDDTIFWYENDGSNNFTTHVLDGDLDGAYPAHVADVDQDGDIDILACGYLADRVVWYENDGNAVFTRHVVDNAADGAHSVVTVDLDDDGDIDLVGSNQDGGQITWYENDGSQNFTRHTIDAAASGAKRAEFADVDNDGDMDVLAASYHIDEIAWYENDGDENFTKHVIDNTANGAYYVFPADMDADGDIDVLSASRLDDTIAWYENDGTGSFTFHQIDGQADASRSVIAADIDGDGDLDPVVTSNEADTVAWYENDGTGQFVKRIVDLTADGAYGVFTVDADRDGDLDILTTSANSNEVNIHYQARLHNVNVEPGGTLTIDESKLLTLDVDDSPADLNYTILDAPTRGELQLNGVPFGVGGTFTQEDVNNGLLTYVHDGIDEVQDEFDFAVMDGGEDAAQPALGIFNIEFFIPIYSDDFSTGTLNTELWRFYDPLGDSTLTMTGTQAAISVPAGVSHDLWTNRLDSPRLLQAAPDRDFEIEVKYDSAVASKYQIQGLVVQADELNLLRYNVQHQGNQVRMFAASINNGSGQTIGNSVISGQIPAYLRIGRTGNLWTFRHSANGADWTTFATFTRALSVTEVGPFVGNHGTPAASSPAFTGLVDYFFNTAAPIVAEDSQVSLSIDDVILTEGNAGSKNFVFTVTSNDNPIDTVTVDFATADGTATEADSDYVGQTGQLVFNPGGPLSQTITVVVNGDAILEANETFFVNLTMVSGTAVLGDAQGLGTILNDEAAPPSIAIDDISLSEGDAGATNFEFTVSLSADPSDQVLVDFATADGSADGTDYTAQSGQLLFNPGGPLAQTITVVVNGDANLEADETFFLNLSLAAGTAVLGDAQGLGTILNDDAAPPSIAIDNVSMAEGDAGTTNFEFTVSLSADPSDQILVDFATANGSADGTDYTAQTGQLAFNPGGSLSQSITIAVNGDTDEEPDETFFVNLTLAQGTATMADSSGTGTILDDDTVFSGIVSDDFSTGALNTSLWTFFDPKGDSTLTMTGTQASIFVPAGVSHDLWTNQLSSPRLLQAAPDTDFEIEVKYDSTTLSKFQIQGLLAQQDAQNIIRFNVQHTGSQTYLFAGAIVNGSGQTVKYSSVAGPAPSYLRLNRTGNTWTYLYSTDGNAWTTFASTSRALNIAQVGPFVGNHGSPASNSPAFTGLVDYFFNTASPIVPEDAAVGVSIDDVLMLEGNSGTTPFEFTVSLSDDPVDPVTINFATSDGSATVANADYANQTGQLVFNPGASLSQTITVLVNGDSVLEPDEDFFVDLSLVSGAAAIVDGEGVGTILNDEATPTSISINDVTLSEGDAGTTNFQFTVSLTDDPSDQVRIDFAAANGTATGSDYVAQTGQITFNPGGGLSQNIVIAVNGDTDPETDETFFVDLTLNSGTAIFSDDQGLGTILDDDTTGPAIISDDFSTGILNTSLWTFVDPRGDSTLTMTGTQAAISVPAGVSHDLWTNRLYAPRLLQTAPDTDFEIEVKFDSTVASRYQNQGLIVQQNLQNLIRFDAMHDGSSVRLFAARITNGSAQAIANQAIGGAFPAYLRLSRAGNAWTFRYSTNGADWTTFATTTHALAVTEVGPLVGNHGAPESSSPAFTGFVDYFFNTASPIVPEDATVGISIDDVLILEGDSGTTDFIFTVTANTDPIDQVTVDFATDDGSATEADNDYVGQTGQVVFNPGGSLTQPITITVNGDTDLELDEEFFVDLTGLSGTAAIIDSEGVGTILNDEQIPTSVSIDDVTAAEGNSGTTNFEFTVALTLDPVDPVVLDYATANGSATVEDFVSQNGQLTFNPGGALSQVITIAVNGDTDVEANENFFVNLTLISGTAVLADDQGVATILDDDSVAGSIESDLFSTGTLDTSLWTFVDPLGDSTLTMTGTHAEISVPAGVSHDLWTGRLFAPRLLQSAQNTDFEIEVKYTSPLVAGSQIQGIIVQQDSTNLIRYDLEFSGKSVRILAARITNGTGAVIANEALHIDGAMYLRLARSGDTWTYRYSTDGQEWMVLTTSALVLNVTSVGAFTGNHSGPSGTPAFTSSLDHFLNVTNPYPSLSVWNGDDQSFGQLGVPQTWVNIVGNVFDPDGIQSLSYSLNGAASVPLNIGPDGRRLERFGDFNADINIADMQIGANTVAISATDNNGFTTVRNVTVQYQDSAIWPLPFSIDWDAVANLDSVGHVVDGSWHITDRGLSSTQSGYDRLVAIGDITWDDYKVETSIVPHDNAIDVGARGVGLLLRWTGHNANPPHQAQFQPLTGWQPSGALGWYRNGAWEIATGNSAGQEISLVRDASGFILEQDRRYDIEFSVETQPDGYHYTLTVTAAEPPTSGPDSIQLTTVQPLSAMPAGSAMLLGHRQPVSFGDVNITPIP